MGSASGEEATQGPSSRDNERILVSVRVRPLNEKEAARNEVVDWECINDTTILCKNNASPERTVYPSSYTFDRVFRPDCSTRQVYVEGAKSVVLSVVSGINSSVFAYGQTSSGKTFTMSGITEYTMIDIFDYIHKHNERDFHLKFSAMEIYNESVRDLLTTDHSPLRLLDDPERGTVVEKLTEETLRDWNHFQELLAICEAQRQIGETFLNEASSRSHQILRLTIESSTREYLGKNNSSTLAATLNFVDLAGSERASQALSAGSRLKEGSHINRSLLTLGTVIRKLSKGGIGHIPYRDSKLTRILQSSLGGNARTAVICTMSPARSYAEQSRNTLVFASCAKEVTTNAHVNVVMSDKALLKHLQRELVRLEGELKTASPPVKAGATDLLRDKDSKIEELERCVRELTQQLDLALSQIHELKQGSDEQHPVAWEGENTSYPKLHVRQASEGSSSETTSGSDQNSFDGDSPTFEVTQSPDRHSGFSDDDTYSISDLDENFPTTSPFGRTFIETPSDASPLMSTQNPDVRNDGHPNSLDEQTPNLSEFDPYMVSQDTGEQTPNSFESDAQNVSEGQNVDNLEHQQVSDGRGAQSPYFVEFDPYQVPDESGAQTSNCSEADQCHASEGTAENTNNYDDVDSHQIPESNREQIDNHSEDYCKEVQCIEPDNVQLNPLPCEEETQPLSNNECTDDERKQEDKPSDMNMPSVQDSSEPSGKPLTVSMPEMKNVNCVERRCLQSGDACSTSPSSAEKVKYEMKNEVANEGDDFASRIEDIHKKLSALGYDTRDASLRTPVGENEHPETPVTNAGFPVHTDCTEKHKSPTDTKERNMALSRDKPQLPDIQVEETPQRENVVTKNMNDVGLSPQDDLDASSPWLSNPQSLQREIIELWDVCNISLLHRTYFFLLFIMGDPEDAIYLEVERRRLSCIRDAFSWGNSIDFNHQKLTPGSSRRTLHGERMMLARLMKRRLSSQERLDLYVKWGINLDSKKRRSQLADHLWVDPSDFDHIKESATVVAKLVRFSKPQVPKEVFGLNLITSKPQGRRRSFGWK